MSKLEALYASSGRCVVAIPVKNEADHILPCLYALAAQTASRAFEVLLLLNDCTDATPALVHDVRGALPFVLHVQECTLPPARASAGLARKMAMDHAANRAGARGILLTTDADSRVAPDWLQTNLAAIAAGADAVAGQAELDENDAAALPRQMLEDESRVQHFTTLLDEIANVLDPDPADPFPRHTQHSGASIAVTTEMFLRAGGIPDVAVGEDRAFFRALQRVDARIRHCPLTRVTVSGRLHGRATGGMADTMRRRIGQPDAWLDDCLEPTADAARRARLRGTARAYWRKRDTRYVEHLAAVLQLPEAVVREALDGRMFGAAWQSLEDFSPVLRRRLIPAYDLDREIEKADALLETLRAMPELPLSAGMARVDVPHDLFEAAG
jgi:GT2 family glycosyltransferase